MVQVAIVGARGYLGREAVRILLRHPDVERIVPVSSSEAGGRLGESVPALAHRNDLVLVPADDPAVREADAVLLATGHGQARALVPSLAARGPRCIIDLSRDHRAEALTGKDGWTYGLPELPPGVTEGTRLIANPGCYPTASVLAAYPALAGGHVGQGPIIADGKSGVSGAGATPRPDLHFAETNESVRAYKVLGHDHGVEIRLALARVETGRPPAGTEGTRPLRFTPHLVPQNRGLLATVYLPAAPGTEIEAVRESYRKAYEDQPFVRLVAEPDTAHVRGANLADVAIDLDPESGLLIARCAIDNLVKGGSGTAVHNLNLALGLEPAAGLPLVGGGP